MYSSNRKAKEKFVDKYNEMQLSSCFGSVRRYSSGKTTVLEAVDNSMLQQKNQVKEILAYRIRKGAIAALLEKYETIDHILSQLSSSQRMLEYSDEREFNLYLIEAENRDLRQYCYYMVKYIEKIHNYTKKVILAKDNEIEYLSYIIYSLKIKSAFKDEQIDELIVKLKKCEQYINRQEQYIYIQHDHLEQINKEFSTYKYNSVHKYLFDVFSVQVEQAVQNKMNIIEQKYRYEHSQLIKCYYYKLNVQKNIRPESIPYYELPDHLITDSDEDKCYFNKNSLRNSIKYLYDNELTSMSSHQTDLYLQSQFTSNYFRYPLTDYNAHIEQEDDVINHIYTKISPILSKQHKLYYPTSYEQIILYKDGDKISRNQINKILLFTSGILIGSMSFWLFKKLLG